ncbi:TetR/AcrR family transcriptional regulator [Streptomyces glomeratus]|uniref:TetR/AcrR family transcriptional regulator n=1 Tax=Streptomyces glomeratus TaxID=284452 RepID=A0ABP6KZ45_9ACTN|nr:TetR/AcrR family transcriptional regulator [Streptomyces glomeratus]MCF1512030.1 TetR/AcrR family transcriptional regulator [Streptomyces glomeratus]
MPRPSVREQLVDAAAECFHERGFNGIGVQEITRAAGVPKGSFYNHFPSKEALAVEIMRRYAVTRRLDMLEDRTLAPAPRLRAHFGYLADDLERFQFARGCLFGNFGAELSAQSADVRSQVESGLDRWTAQVTSALEEARSAGTLKSTLEPETLAGFLVNAWEGAALRAKVTRSREPLDDFLTLFDSLVA